MAASTLETQYFPLLDRDQFHIEVEFSAQTSIGQTRERMIQARETILEHETVQDVHWFVGESAPRFYYNLTGNRENQAHYARAIVQLKSDEGVSELAQDLQNELDVQAFITTGVLPNTVLTALKERLAAENFELPPGYRYEFGGEYAERNTAIGNLLLYVPLLVLVMITALVLSLGSFRQPGIIAAVAVGSIGMALFSLKVFGSLLGFMAIVGTMGLVGIAINGAIIVLSAFNDDAQASQGKPRAVQTLWLKRLATC